MVHTVHVLYVQIELNLNYILGWQHIYTAGESRDYIATKTYNRYFMSYIIINKFLCVTAEE